MPLVRELKHRGQHGPTLLAKRAPAALARGKRTTLVRNKWYHEIANTGVEGERESGSSYFSSTRTCASSFCGTHFRVSLFDDGCGWNSDTRFCKQGKLRVWQSTRTVGPPSAFGKTVVYSYVEAYELVVSPSPPSPSPSAAGHRSSFSRAHAEVLRRMWARGRGFK